MNIKDKERIKDEICRYVSRALDEPLENDIPYYVFRAFELRHLGYDEEAIEYVRSSVHRMIELFLKEPAGLDEERLDRMKADIIARMKENPDA